MTDEIIDLLTSKFNVENTGNAVSTAHPRFSQFKNVSKATDKQNDRRVEAIKTQRRKRHELYETFRDAFHDGKQTSAADNDEQSDESPKKDEDKHRNSSGSKRRSNESSKKSGGPAKYKNQLMLSEWLNEIPDDFEENWLLIPCPVGKRCLLVSQYGRTSVYTRTGHLLLEFDAVPFPGGSRSTQRNALTLIDAFYCEVQRRFYLLDVLCWNNVPLFDSDFEMRRFWLKATFDEHKQSQERADSARRAIKSAMDVDSQQAEHAVASASWSCGSYSLELLPTWYCQPTELERSIAMCHFEQPVELDGLLFLHKHAHYVAGVTPLACWLHAWMAVEVFALDRTRLHKDYVAKIPAEFRTPYELSTLAPCASPVAPPASEAMDGDCAARSPPALNSLLHANAAAARSNWEKKAQRLQQNDKLDTST